MSGQNGDLTGQKNSRTCNVDQSRLIVFDGKDRTKRNNQSLTAQDFPHMRTFNGINY